MAKISLLSNYLASPFVASYDGHGVTNIVDPLAATSQSIAPPLSHAGRAGSVRRNYESDSSSDRNGE